MRVSGLGLRFGTSGTLGLLVALAVSGCGSTSTTDPSTAATGGDNPTKATGANDVNAPAPPAPGATATGGSPEVPPPPPTPVDTTSGTSVADALAARVVGHYAVRLVLASIQDAPMIGKTPSVSTSLGLAEIQKAGAGLVVVEHACHVDLSSSGLVQPTVPDALPLSVPAVTFPLRVWDEAGVVKFVRDSVPIGIGVKLVDADKDALPTAATDPRVWDQDGDGKPGVTVKMSGFVSGDIYVVQRQRSVYAGTVAASGALAGLVTDTSEQATIGSTNDILKQPVKSAQDPDGSKSTVTFAKLASVYDCARAVREATTLFPAP